MNKVKYKINKLGFTLVELLVVILILSVLGTIAFLSYQGYSSSARDTRRISDVENVKKALELFYANTGRYPEPDNAGIASISGELMWTQGVIGDNVTRNLSNTLETKPVDPLLEIEYIYSVANNKREYQIMYISESGILSNNILLNEIYALNNIYIPKIDGTYNEVYINTANYFVPIPSIITSEDLPLELMGSGAIKSMVINNGKNFPNFNIPNINQVTGELDIDLNYFTKVNLSSSDSDKISSIYNIQTAFSGTILAEEGIYKTILAAQNDQDRLKMANCLFGGECEVLTGESDYEEIIIAENAVDIILSGIDGTIFTCDLCN